MMGGRNWSVSITAYRRREFYSRCSKQTISTLSESSVWGKNKLEKKKTDFENLDSFWDSLNRVGKIYNVRLAWTLKKLVRRVKEFTGRQQWKNVT